MTEENKVYLYGDSEIVIAALNARARGSSCGESQQKEANGKVEQVGKVGDNKKKKSGKTFLYGASDAFVKSLRAHRERKKKV